MIDNDNWECQKQKEGNIICEDTMEYSDRKITLESGRTGYASIRAKTDRGEDLVASSHQDQLNITANRLSVNENNGRVNTRIE